MNRKPKILFCLLISLVSFSAEASSPAELAAAWKKFCISNTYDAKISKDDSRALIEQVSDTLLEEPGTRCIERAIRTNFPESIRGKWEQTLEKKKTEIQNFENNSYPNANKKPSTDEIQKVTAAIEQKVAQNSVGCSLLNEPLKIQDASGATRSVSLFQYDEVLEKTLPSFFPSIPQTCQNEFMQRYMTEADADVDNNNLGYKKFCGFYNTSGCQLQEKKRNLRSKNLKWMAEATFSAPVAASLRCDADPKSVSAQLKDLLKPLVCADLKVGEGRVIDAHTSESLGVAMSGDYSLKRVDEHHYQARLNFNFVQTPGTRVTSEQMMNRVKDCMRTFNPYMKGPNGDRLEIIPLSNSETAALPTQERPLGHVITINRDGFMSGRAESTAYDESASCSRIAHEILHVLGLTDEYIEPAGSQLFDGGSKCRPNARVDSMMRNHEVFTGKVVGKVQECKCDSPVCKAVFESNDSAKIEQYLGESAIDIFDGAFLQKYCSNKTGPRLGQISRAMKVVDFSALENPALAITQTHTDQSMQVETRKLQTGLPLQVRVVTLNCSCPDGDAACKRQLIAKRQEIRESNAGNRNQSCPTGSLIRPAPDQNANRDTDIKFDPASGVFQYQTRKKTDTRSLLLPSQWDRILGGSCTDKGKNYNECAKWSYKGNHCDQVPAFCHDMKGFLGVDPPADP